MQRPEHDRTRAPSPSAGASASALAAVDTTTARAASSSSAPLRSSTAVAMASWVPSRSSSQSATSTSLQRRRRATKAPATAPATPRAAQSRAQRAVPGPPREERRQHGQREAHGRPGHHPPDQQARAHAPGPALEKGVEASDLARLGHGALHPTLAAPKRFPGRAFRLRL